MNEGVKQLIEMLRAREEGMWEQMERAVERNDELDRIHYIGWYRGIQGSRMLVEYLQRDNAFKDKE
jgi:hypothetical protein